MPAPEHPTHPAAVASGLYLSAWCGSGGYGGSRGCATRLGHFMGWRGPAGRRARGSGHPTGHLPALGTHRWVIRGGSTVGHWISPRLISCCHRPSPYLPRLFFYCHRELPRHRAEHSRPSSPLVGPASSSGTTPERSHLSPSLLGEAKIPRDDFPSSAGWVCSPL